MDFGGSMDKRDSRGSSISSTGTPPAESASVGGPSGAPSGIPSGGPTGVMRRRGSLFELVTGREPITSGRNLSGSDNSINTRHRSLDSRLPKPTSQPFALRRTTATPTGVTIVRPTKEARKAEIVAAVTRRLYTARKKPDPRAEPPPSLSENVEEADQIEPKELKLCSNARARLQEISKRALALGLHRRLRKDSDTQTEAMTSALRVKEKSVSTDEPTKEIAVETTTTACEANLVVNFGKRVEMAEKSSQWRGQSASIGTQSGLYSPPVCPLFQPVYSPPFWMNNWWPNLTWSMGCCHHEPKRRANVSVDGTDDFSDDSLESLCGISRIGPDGASGDGIVSEPKPALWETLTLRSGKQFKDNSTLYQPDIFRTPHPLSSIFDRELSYLGREDKSTETESKTEMEVDEKACNTEPLKVTTDEESQTACPVHGQGALKPSLFQVPSFVTPVTKPVSFSQFREPSASHFQVVCNFTVACNAVQGVPLLEASRCSCDPQYNLNLPPVSPITASSEEVNQPTSSASNIQSAEIQSSAFHCPETPFCTPDIIAQASNDCKKISSPDGEGSATQPLPEPETPNRTENQNEVLGLWETDRPFVSLDNNLLQPKVPASSEFPSHAASLDNIFQSIDKHQTRKENRPTSSSVKKFRLPCLSENNTPLVPASVTARALDEVSSPAKLEPASPTKLNVIQTKRITPSSFLSPKGRRLLLTWLNNPGSNPSMGNAVKTGRKTFNGRVSRRHAGFREKCHRRIGVKRAGTAETEKVSIYHNLSLLIAEATNYVRTMNQSRPQSSDSQVHSIEKQTGLISSPTSHSSEVQTKTVKVQDCGTQIDNYRSVSLNTDPAQTAEKAISTPERSTTGTQCTLNFSANSRKQSNTFALLWISRSTQTDMSLWNDKYLSPDDILLEAQSIVSDDLFYDPVPHFITCPKFHDRPVNIYEVPQTDEYRSLTRYDSSNLIAGYCGRSLRFTEFSTSSRLPCQHSRPRAYLQHLVSLRRGIVEACQSPPARPTGVG